MVALKTLKSSHWREQLRLLLSQPEKSLPRLAIVGIGQTLRGDDGAGSVIVRRLEKKLDPHPSLQITDAGHAPENCLGHIIRFRPDVVLFVDAVRGDQRPGTPIWLQARDADSAGGSTHTLSLGMIADYLTMETRANIYVLGIQPSDMRLSEGLSSQVETAVERIAETISTYWRNAIAACSAMSTGDTSVVNA